MHHAALSALLVLVGLLVAGPVRAAGSGSLARAVITEAAGRLNDQLAALARSTQALGAAYAALHRDTPAPTPEERNRFLQSYAVKDGTVAFRDPQNACGPEPPAQAPCQSLFYYNGENFTDRTFQQLAALSRLAPAMAAAAETLPYSWVYLTTPDQNFAIYPALPLDAAINNFQPTDKGFYTAANFEAKTCGWESPYLDLAGAGMMVTVSCPAYDGETLLGVASRDVTLAQLSQRVLAELSALPGAKAILINRRGKAIAASDPKLAAFIVETNTKAGDAVAYFRADRGLTALGVEKGVASPDEALNDSAEMVIERAATEKRWPLVFPRGKETVLAARLDTTGWYLILVLPAKAAQ